MAGSSSGSESTRTDRGLETTLAQVAHEILGIDNREVKVVHGDTAFTPYSTGTWGSRCMVMAGGAVAAACEELGERVKHLAAHLLQVVPERVELRDGAAWGPGGGQVSLADVGRLWYRQPENLPDDVNPRGVEVTQGYRAVRDSGTFSYACHACVVEVDVETGGIEILDYVVVEDGGVLVNPMIVDGQVLGGAAQGIGTALYEGDAVRRSRAAASPPRSPTTGCRGRPRFPRFGSSTWKRPPPTAVSARRESARAGRSARPPRSRTR